MTKPQKTKTKMIQKHLKVIGMRALDVCNHVYFFICSNESLFVKVGMIEPK